MSRPITPAYTFAPAAHQINLTGISGFDLRLLVGIVNLTTGNVVYGRGLPGYGCSAIAGTLLTLQAPMIGMSAADVLVIKYDDFGLPAQDASLQTLATANHTDLAAILTKLGTKLSVSIDGDSIALNLPAGLAQDATLGALGTALVGFATANHADLGATTAKMEAVRALLAAALTINLPTGAATAAGQTAGNDTLASILTALELLATDADVQATTTKVEAVRALLAGTLSVAPQSNAPRVFNSAPLAALNTSVTLAVDGMGTAGVQISGTWVGTIAWSGSMDGGASYFPISATPFGSGGGPSAGSATANGQWELSAALYTHVRATMTGWTSGSASVLLAASSGGKIARVKAPASDPLPTVDANNAPFSTATALTSGQLAAAGKSVGVNATAAGNVVLTLTGGGTLTLPVFAGWQTFPFAATQFAFALGAAGSVYNLS